MASERYNRTQRVPWRGDYGVLFTGVRAAVEAAELQPAEVSTRLQGDDSVAKYDLGGGRAARPCAVPTFSEVLTRIQPRCDEH